MFRRTLAALAATSMAASPVLAQATAAPLSVARAGAPTEDGNNLRGGPWLPPILFAAIVIAGILTAAGVIFDDDDDDVPASP